MDVSGPAGYRMMVGARDRAGERVICGGSRSAIDKILELCLPLPMQPSAQTATGSQAWNT